MRRSTSTAAARSGSSRSPGSGPAPGRRPAGRRRPRRRHLRRRRAATALRELQRGDGCAPLDVDTSVRPRPVTSTRRPAAARRPGRRRRRCRREQAAALGAAPRASTASDGLGAPLTRTSSTASTATSPPPAGTAQPADDQLTPTTHRTVNRRRARGARRTAPATSSTPWRSALGARCVAARPGSLPRRRAAGEQLEHLGADQRDVAGAEGEHEVAAAQAPRDQLAAPPTRTARRPPARPAAARRRRPARR